METNHHPICYAIPPHISRHVAEHTEDGARQRARETLVTMNVLAQARANYVIQRPATSFSKRRNVYDARKSQTLPGKLVMSEHKKRGRDIEVNEAYDGCGATYDFYAAVFGRNSIDGHGLRLDSTVHFGKNFDNAMWNGSQMIYGDGDRKLFNRFTAALDVIGHELTHGVTQFSSSLGYQGQTGALNEHLSDAFGIMIKQYTLGLKANESDWLIGVGLLGPNVQGKAVRSMAAPGTAYDDPVLGRDPQPDHMDRYDTTADDHGGIHVNSGIPNHAFYLAAIEIGGETCRVLGRIWYQTLTTRLSPTAQFHDFAAATVAVAGEEYGPGGLIQQIVMKAWADVGISVPDALTKPRAIQAERSFLPIRGAIARFLDLI
jgi:Zn-dependent metalloprotease